MERPKVSAHGLAVFGALRAEDEPWLEECFVPPAEFDLMGGAPSAIVFGPPGIGKSAVRAMLVRRAGGPEGFLAVHWQPNPAVWKPASGFQSVPGQVAHIFDLCAAEVLRHLVANPEQWNIAPDWARQMLAWFIHRFLQGAPPARLGDLIERDGAAPVIADLLHARPEEDILPPNDWSQVAVELSKAIRRLGWRGIWIIVDGVEPWMDRAPDRLLQPLNAFLSSLPLFEQAFFAYKVFLPSALQSQLAAAAGVERRRLYPFWLSWTEEQLIRIAERRLALALGQPDFSLQMLCRDQQFMKWLRRVGGDIPRAWLELVRPMVVHYLETGKPLTREAWEKLRRQFPPRLVLDEINNQITVGGRVIPLGEIPAGAYRLLHYLYKNAGRIVPWDELYYRGYRGKERIPRPADEGYESPKVYEGILYSRISDLRRVIEPDPRNPIYLETVRDKGVRLRLTW